MQYSSSISSLCLLRSLPWLINKLKTSPTMINACLVKFMFAVSRSPIIDQSISNFSLCTSSYIPTEFYKKKKKKTSNPPKPINTNTHSRTKSNKRAVYAKTQAALTHAASKMDVIGVKWRLTIYR